MRKYFVSGLFWLSALGLSIPPKLEVRVYEIEKEQDQLRNRHRFSPLHLEDNYQPDLREMGVLRNTQASQILSTCGYYEAVPITVDWEIFIVKIFS